MSRRKSLKTILQNNELTLGSWLSFGNTQTCEIMARAGFDWLVIDMEHTAIDNSQCLELIQIVENCGCIPLVRVSENNSLSIKRAMDAGAHGVIVPMVNTVGDAQKAIDSLYYPPKGSRGVGLARAQGYGVDFDNYRDWATNETIFIPQIEHIDGVSNLEAILSLDEVDGFIIGPYDLSGSLGFPGQWNQPSVVKALKKVEEIVSVSSKPAGFHIVHSDHKELSKRIKQGFKFIAYGDDMVFFAETIAAEADYLLNFIK